MYWQGVACSCGGEDERNRCEIGVQQVRNRCETGAGAKQVRNSCACNERSTSAPLVNVYKPNALRRNGEAIHPEQTLIADND